MNKPKSRRGPVWFWAEYCLETIGLIVAVTVAYQMITLIGAAGFGWQIFFTMFPLYMTIIGAMVILLMMMTFFGTYVPVLLSVNETRRRLVRGLMLSGLGITAVLMLLSVVSQAIGLGGLRLEDLTLLPGCAGGMLAAEAIGILAGILSLRWGRLGVLVGGLVGAAIGGFAGLGVGGAVAGKSSWIRIPESSIVDFWSLAVFVAGAVLYLLAAVLLRLFSRKLEVRR